MTIREAEEQDFSAICTLMKNELGYSDLNETEVGFIKVAEMEKNAVMRKELK